jgi:NAD(P)-dependent dehydrogenase (short-subunit alcohol dehydrogenase family)
VTDLTGKVAVVTGANSGIGKETAAELAAMGAQVVIAARNPAKAAAAVKEIKDRTHCGDRVTTMPLDLASFASVRAFGGAFTDTFDRCDILVNNAGLMLRKRATTEDGHEVQFQTNHLGPFLLTNLLHDRLAPSDAARVVNVASDAHRMGGRALKFDDLDWTRRHYGGFRVYSATKLMNVLFTRELAQRWGHEHITANAAHPGFVRSNFGREGDYGIAGRIVMPIAAPLAISVAKGARTPVFLASSADVEGVTGLYFAKCASTQPSAAACNDATAKQLWDVSAELTGVS